MDILFTGLMLFLIAGAIVALEMRDLLSSIIAVGVVGLGLSILFLLLCAPDIAITQVVVEVIVVTVLIRAASVAGKRTLGKTGNATAVLIGVLGLILLTTFAVVAFWSLPAFGHHERLLSEWYLRNGLELTGSTSLVMAIILDFRAYDTLGEVTVFVTAILGALVVLRQRPRRAVVPPLEESPTKTGGAEGDGEPVEEHHA